ncbi:polyketide synthase [Micromonospora sp. RTGN7]|uniref:beta-ketoacyl [acyl carrier protein] synthase domain-containing protein n=1 Tax=Micromonospora sp. RTGN7 TaxID=3016526 RepID=UPI0029FF38C7|nr:polyketide synthase [Micromonospora sp. RTGN7]
MTGPIAVVGMAVRAPGGVDSLDAYWSAILHARDLTGDLPEDRRGAFGADWDGMVTRGGYLDAPFDFDPKFFGIAPKEARVLDPQHRLLLEVTWEAFEHAAIPVAAVAEATGVFVGITGRDYWQWLTGDPNSYWTIGNGHSFAAGRIAYTLGLQGPVFALDTACSSSLVSVHTACRALVAGDCDVAVAGGVNLILAPGTTRSVAQTGALSPEGRSRPFDAGANGFVRGEGCGMLLLKRLADARRDGDRILAVINGTGINHDGRTSTFTTPNVSAQARLIDSVLAAAGVSAGDIGFHEAHGTGTPLGDPAELAAIGAALGRRDGRPLYVGSVKGNIGHTESAAGVLGLVKAVLCVHHRTIAPQANYQEPNPRIDLSGTGIEIPVAPVPWDDRIGGCASTSSYGMSGTNAYAVLSPAPPPEPARNVPAADGILLSAATPAALAALARRYAAHLAALPAADYPAFTCTANNGRTRLKHAVWVQAAEPGGAAAALSALADGSAHPAVRTLDPGDPVPAVPARAVVSLPGYPWQRGTYVVAPA